MKQETLDARRLLCPMPVIRTQQAVKKLEVGDELEVICTDPGTMHDIPTWCRMYGHQVLFAEQRDKEFVFRIKVVVSKDSSVSEATKKEEW